MTGPYYADAAVTLYAGDCLDVLPTLPDNSVDAVVTDPPYGLGFMGKQWDQPGQYGSMRKGPKRRDITAGAVGVDHKTTTERSASMVAGDYDLSLTGNQTFGFHAETLTDKGNRRKLGAAKRRPPTQCLRTGRGPRPSLRSSEGGLVQ